MSPSPINAPHPTFRPTATPEVLRLRARLRKQLRAFFDERGFLEVETPLLSADTVVEPHVDPLSLTLPDDPRHENKGGRLWLQTSPEFHMKRMLATGEYDAIYQITRAFRSGERGERHSPEFTMVEWYRVGDDMAAGMQLLSDLCEAIFDRGPAEPIGYAEALRRYGGMPADFDPHTVEPDRLQESLKQELSGAPETSDRDELLNFLLATRIEPQLGRGRPAILFDYPATQASLARVETNADGDQVARRFELYMDGLELANGYYELLDADELRRRNARSNEKRRRDGKPALPQESRVLDAMRHGLPECAGVALGFDRLVMVAAGVETIDDVLSFPIERA